MKGGEKLSEFGVPTQGQLDKINALAKRTLSKDEVFVFPNKLAGDMIIPDRYIQLHKSALNVFKQNAQEGVSLLLDHSWASSGLFGMGGRPKAAIPYGRTFDATIRKSEVEGEKWALNADHYMVRGIEIDSISTDSLIQSVEAGTMFDTSIGWGANTFECSICGNDIRYFSKCEHYPGETYEVNGEEKLCYAIAKPPAFLMENSLVFDGAYPTAGVLSQMGNGIDETSNVVMVENIKEIPMNVTTYSILSASRGQLFTYAKKDDLAKGNVLSVPDLSNLKGGGEQVNEEVLKLFESIGIAYKHGETKTEEVFEQLVEKWDAVIKESNDKAVADALAEQVEGIELSTEALIFYMTQEQATEALGKELSADEVLTYAKEGEAYMNQLVQDAIAMGVRAQGNDFPAETWKTTFAGMNSQGIKDIMATFARQAKEEIPAGRLSTPLSQQNIARTIPDDSFKVGK